jgi:hypothetical protein
MRQERGHHGRARRRRGRRGVVAVATIGIVATGATVAGAEITKDNDRKLAAVGPVGAYGFPVWYEDHTGLRLEQCLDATDAYCDPAFLTAEGLDPAEPLHIGRGPADSNWPGESFYYAANNSFDLPDGTRFDFVSALEATFANEEVAEDDQVTFGRLRIRFEDAQPGGTYTITHPYGVDTLTADADGEIRYVQDKTPAPDNFGLALDSRIAPFLVDADGLHETPNGSYVGQPGVETTVTGSTYGTNYIEITGPGLATPFRDATFDLMGKVATNSGIVPVAAYRIDNAGTAQDHLDVYATAGPNDAVQVAGEGIPLTTLAGSGSNYYARIPVAANTFPSTVTVINASDDPVAEMTLPVTANVAVTGATYSDAADSTGGTLTVTAVSSDSGATLAGTVGAQSLVFTDGTATLTGMAAPPATVTVTASTGGSDVAPVLVSSATAGEAVQQTAVVAGATAVVGGESLTLDGSSSTNASGFSWAQTAGTPVLGGIDTTAPSITFAAPAEAGTLTFVLTTTGPLGTRTATHSVAVSAPVVADETAITAGQLRTTTREWRVDGTSTVTTRNTVTVYLTRADGTGRELIGTGTVDATGTWAVRVANGVVPPTGFTRLVAESSQGGVSPLFTYTSRR